MTNRKTSKTQQERLELLRNYLRGVNRSEGDLRDVLLDLLDTGRIHPLARRRTLHDVSDAYQVRVGGQRFRRHRRGRSGTTTGQPLLTRIAVLSRYVPAGNILDPSTQIVHIPAVSRTPIIPTPFQNEFPASHSQF